MYENGINQWISKNKEIVAVLLFIGLITVVALLGSRRKATTSTATDTTLPDSQHNPNEPLYAVNSTTIIANTYNTTTTNNNPVSQPITTPVPVPIQSHPIINPIQAPVSSNPTPPPRTVTTTTKRRIWDERYVVKSGDTLSSIAQNDANWMHSQGMPASITVTWQDIYSHNQATIESDAMRHGNPIPGGPQNNIFPGEVLVIARWG